MQQDAPPLRDTAAYTSGVELAESAMRITVTLGGEAGARRWQRRLPTPPAPDEAVDVVASLVEHAIGETARMPASEHGGALRSVGMALWGEVDGHAGLVRRLPPVPAWEGFPLAERLARRLSTAGGVPVMLASAAQAAALLEARRRAGAAESSLLYVHLGRVVASGYVSRGRLLTGAHGTAGDLAHVTVQPGGPRCGCGGHGHLDTLASTQAMVRMMIGRAADSEASTAAMLRVSGGRAEAMTALQVVQLAQEGEPVAREVVDEALAALASALAQAVPLLDPDLIILDSVLMEGQSRFLDMLQLDLNRRCGARTPAPPLRAASWPRDAALFGAHLVGELGAAALG